MNLGRISECKVYTDCGVYIIDQIGSYDCTYDNKAFNFKINNARITHDTTAYQEALEVLNAINDGYCDYSGLEPHLNVIRIALKEIIDENY